MVFLEQKLRQSSFTSCTINDPWNITLSRFPHLQTGDFISADLTGLLIKLNYIYLELEKMAWHLMSYVLVIL